jgi:hypothetical protein
MVLMSDIGYTCYHSMLWHAVKCAETEYRRIYDYYRDRHGKTAAAVPAANDDPDLQAETCDAVETAKLALIVLLASYIEAVSNLYLSMKLDTAQFELVERSSLLDKWLTVPSFFLPGYQFPAGTSLHEDLVTLIKRRNGIVHPKPELSRDGKVIHRGNLPASEVEHGKVKKWLTLPKRLADHLHQYDHSQDGEGFFSGIELDETRTAETLKRRPRRSDPPFDPQRQ